MFNHADQSRNGSKADVAAQVPYPDFERRQNWAVAFRRLCRFIETNLPNEAYFEGDNEGWDMIDFLRDEVVADWNNPELLNCEVRNGLEYLVREVEACARSAHTNDIKQTVRDEILRDGGQHGFRNDVRDCLQALANTSAHDLLRSNVPEFI